MGDGVGGRAGRGRPLPAAAGLLLGMILLGGCGMRRYSPGTQRVPAARSSISRPSLSAAGRGGGAAPSATGASSSVAAPANAQLAPYFRPDGSATAGRRPVRVTAMDFAFAPNVILASAGRPVHLEIANTSSDAHDFSLPALGVEVALPAGRTTAVSFTPPRAGVYWFWCDLPGHSQAGMVGQVRVGAG